MELHELLLDILEINPLSVVSFEIIFSHSESCLFILFIVSFAVLKLLSLIRSHLFVFISITLGAGVKIYLQCRRPWFDSWVGKISWRRDRLHTLQYSWACLVAQLVKNLPAIQETWV